MQCQKRIIFSSVFFIFVAGQLNAQTKEVPASKETPVSKEVPASLNKEPAKAPTKEVSAPQPTVKPAEKAVSKANSKAKLNNSELPAKNVIPTPEKKKMTRHQKDLILGIKSDLKGQVASLRKALAGYVILYKNEKDPLKRIQIKLSVIATHLNIARAIMLETSDEKYFKQDLDNAEKYATEIVNDKNTKPIDKARALYYKGLVLIERNNTPGARDAFVESFKVVPDTENSATMGLFIAESYFESEKYMEAIKYYQKTYPKFSNDQKALATYKIAWCFINMQKYHDAEKMFLNLVGKPWAKEFAKDSLKDLAYTVTQYKSETEIIIYGKQYLSKDPNLLKEFFIQALNFLQSQKGNSRYTLLFNEILKAETNTEKRYMLHLGQLRAHQKEFAATAPFLDFLGLRKMLYDAKVTTQNDQLKNFFIELEPEVEKLIKTHTEAFTGKTKIAEDVKKETLNERLMNLLEFHLAYYPKSKNKSVSYRLLLDLCEAQKSQQCSLNLGRRIMADPMVPEMRAQANLEILKALETIEKSDKSVRPQFVQYLMNFFKEQPSDSQWLTIAKKLSAILLEEKKNKDAIPILESIHKKENTTQSLFRLTLAQYEEGNYEWVVKVTTSGPDDENIKKIKELIRESSLKLANVFVSKNDFQNYEKYLNQFFALNKDEKKEEIAKKDFYSRLFEKKMYDRLADELKRNSVAKQFDGSYKDLTKGLITEYILAGNLAKAYEILKQTKLGQFKSYDMEWFILNMGLLGTLDEKQLKYLQSVDKPIKEYVLGLNTLFNPTLALKILRMNKKLTLEDKQQLYTLYKLNEEQEEFKITPALINELIDVVPQDLKNSLKKTTTENKAAAITFPKNEGKYTKDMEKVMAKTIEKVRAVRKLVLDDLKDQTIESQMRIIDSAIMIEQKTAEMITRGPTPENLTDEQKLEYQKGISEVANEFTNQADEYVKMKNNILTAEATKREKNNKEKAFAKFIDDTSWPKEDLGKALEEHQKNKQYLAALIVLDVWKSQKKITDKDYYPLRIKCILGHRLDEKYADYVYQELIAAKLESLVNLQEGKSEKEEPKDHKNDSKSDDPNQNLEIERK